MSQDLSFLIVDDEKIIIDNLRAILRKFFPEAVIYAAFNGKEAWDVIDQKFPRIVISDIAMPEMDGINLCKKVRSSKFHKHTYFIIITGQFDKNKRLKALEEGVDDYINKPFDNDELVARLNSAIRVVKLQSQMKEENDLLMELADELRNDIKEMSDIALKFINARMPEVSEMLDRVAQSSLWIAKHLDIDDEEDLNDLELAAKFSYVGKVFLPDEMIKLPVTMNGIPTNNLMYQVPVFAKDIISSVRRFKDISKIIFHLFENYDGSGFPDKLKSWQIPIASRIIRVALDFEEMHIFNNEPPQNVLKDLRREIKRLYDHRCVTLMDQYIAHTGREGLGINEKGFNVEELENGMIVSRDIFTHSGMKLLSQGTVLRDETIRKIKGHNSSDAIIGWVFVKS